MNIRYLVDNLALFAGKTAVWRSLIAVMSEGGERTPMCCASNAASG